jgi:hypothetical protein
MARTASASPADMPTLRRANGATGEGDTADMKVNVQQHEFSGKTCQIKLFKGEHKTRDQYFGINHYNITIQFDKWVEVPVEMADHIESLYYAAKEPDPEDPENEFKFVYVDRRRFPAERRD